MSEVSLDEEFSSPKRPFWKTEDGAAVLFGLGWLAIALATTWAFGSGPDGGFTSPLSGWLAKPAGWTDQPAEAFWSGEDRPPLIGIAGVLLVAILGFTTFETLRGQPRGRFVIAFLGVFAGALLAYVLAGQAVIKSYNLEYALWALAVGLLVSNTIGTPEWVRPALRTELFIKTGLVILGAEVLFSKLLALGVPGIFVAWIVTPIVLISTFWFGQKILRMASPSLNMVISADMSVCGVSAAIATAAACKAKKEELSLAIGLSLTFTVIMMVVMPAVIKATGMSAILGGAWMGGTIDATGAVAASGALLGDDALVVATTIKMIQNVLIGVVAFGVALYWVMVVERNPTAPRPGLAEIGRRFPRFILGFLVASISFSLVYSLVPNGPELVDATIKGGTKTLRGWFFCLAFVSIGLETNFRQLASQLQGGKPLILYLVGQSLNLCLTLAMAWLMFEVVFPQAAEAIAK